MNEEIKKKLAGMKPVFDKVSPEFLATMPYEYAGKDIDIVIDSEEFSCLCPWSGLPDFASLTVSYVPDREVVELKSLKYYLQSFRMVGMVHESVVNRILQDLSAAAKPKWMQVELTFNIRGGITTTVSAEYTKE